jgi:hypothetical protein
MSDCPGKLAVVRTEEQPAGIDVEASDWIEPLVDASQQVTDRSAALRVAQRGNYASRFVQQNVAERLRPEGNWSIVQ